MQKIVLGQPELEQLTALIGEIPFKHAVGLANYLAELASRQQFEQRKKEADFTNTPPVNSA